MNTTSPSARAQQLKQRMWRQAQVKRVQAASNGRLNEKQANQVLARSAELKKYKSKKSK